MRRLVCTALWYCTLLLMAEASLHCTMALHSTVDGAAPGLQHCSCKSIIPHSSSSGSNGSSSGGEGVGHPHYIRCELRTRHATSNGDFRAFAQRPLIYLLAQLRSSLRNVDYTHPLKNWTDKIRLCVRFAAGLNLASEKKEIKSDCIAWISPTHSVNPTHVSPDISPDISSDAG
jgi:hypothetical protein